MGNNTVHVTADNFENAVIDADTPVVVDFWAPWCGPCKAIAPVLDDLATRYAGKVKVAKLNVDDEPAVAQAFQIRGIPTLLAFSGGKVVHQMVGFGGKGRLEALFDALADQQ